MGTGSPLRRNTSTDVEKTDISHLCYKQFWKHLHGRGEDTGSIESISSFSETPPRTWRRPPSLCLGTRWRGNTSTDVEKTDSRQIGHRSARKHLHGRGEDRPDNRRSRHRARNTSTDVEKTWLEIIGFEAIEKHLHGRGEDAFASLKEEPFEETPPRTWRRLTRASLPDYVSRNTSTDVEKTTASISDQIAS